MHRKGRNNSVTAAPDDVGSPWAIGSDEGGHDAVHPELGTIDDFDDFVAAAREAGPRGGARPGAAVRAGPSVGTDHPEWFTVLPDGTIAYAENPPKKYQDIYPINFDNDPAGIYEEVLRVVRYWISHGVKIFRVDNPHTKPPNFWAWLIGEVKNDDPDVLFLAEAFTRPARLFGLAKLGFTQSYTYFTWRTAKWELTEFGEQIAEHADYARPNLFVNTPDILHESLQHGGPGMFAIRAALAATMSPTWGVYSGYELFEHRAVREGSEEYLDSEKYELRPRDFDAALADGESLEPFLDPAQRDSAAAPGAAAAAHHQVPPRRQRRAAGLQQVRPDHRRCGAGGGDPQPVRPRGRHAVAGHGARWAWSRTTASGCATRSPARNTTGGRPITYASNPARAVAHMLNMPPDSRRPTTEPAAEGVTT